MPSVLTGEGFEQAQNRIQCDDVCQSVDSDFVFGVVQGCENGSNSTPTKQDSPQMDCMRVASQPPVATAAQGVSNHERFSHAHAAHDQGRLHPGAFGTGRGSSTKVVGPRASHSVDRTEGGERPSFASQQASDRFPVLGSQHEQVPQEGGPDQLPQDPLQDPADGERNDGAVAEVGHSPHLRGDGTSGRGPSGIWTPLCTELRGAVHASHRLCQLGQEDGLGGAGRLPPTAVGPLDRGHGQAIEHRDPEGNQASMVWSPDEAGRQAGALQRIHLQLQCERGASDAGAQSPGGCGRPEGGAPPEEGRASGREHVQPLLCGDDTVSALADESRGQFSSACHLFDVDVSQEVTWEPLPEHKARQLSFQASEVLPEAFGSLLAHNRLKLLEVACSPDSRLTEAVNRASKSEMSAKRCSLFNGYDLSTNAGIHKVLRDVDELNPEHVWLSPVCGPYSVMQNVNQRNPKQCEELQSKRRDALKQYVGCALVYTYCCQRGIHVTWEWSQSCLAWRLPLMQQLVQRFQPYFAVTRGCQVGLKDNGGNYISKGWKLMTTDKHLARRMDLPCKCPKDTVHVKCEGSITPKTAFYPEDFAKRVSRALQQSCSRDDLLQELKGQSCLLDHFGNGVSCECVSGQQHGAELTCGMCSTKNMKTMKHPPKTCHTDVTPGILSPDEATRNINMSGNPVGVCMSHPMPTLRDSAPHGGILNSDEALRNTSMGSPATNMPHDSTPPTCHAPHAGIFNPDEATRTSCTGPLEESRRNPQHGLGTQEISPKDPGLTRAEIQKKLQLLHSATGHGPVRHLIQALRRRGVHRSVLEEAERFVCSICKERERPKPRPKSSFEPLPPKWSTIAADMGTWEHPQNGKSYQFLLVIDEGSRFRIGRVLGEGRKYHVGASQFLETLQEGWCQYFGLPDTLRLDPDGTFRSKAVEEYCDRHQVFLDMIPGEAHWKLGICENAIKGVKELMTRVAMESPEVTTSEALSEATRVFNNREMIRGFSPLQHALGRAPDPTGRIFPRAGSECPELLMENATGEFSRNLQRMKAAEQAFLDWTAQQRISRASHSKGRPFIDYQPGDLVYIWRQQVSGQSTAKGGAFVGPARVLALEHHISKDGHRKPGSSVWCVRGRRLWKCSLEQLRMASEKEVLMHELHSAQPESWDFHRIAEQLGGNEYLDLSKEVPTDMEWETGHEQPAIPWKPTHRYAGKRGPSPVRLDPGSREMQCEPATGSGRGTRSRSPKPSQQTTPAPSVEDSFSTGEHWYDGVQDAFMTHGTECTFWTAPSAAVEVMVEMPTTRASSERALSDFPAFFVNNFKRRAAIEVCERHLTPEEKTQFKAAKAIEVSNFIAAKAFEVLPEHLKPSAAQAIRMRWILTWKYKEDGSKKAKSRAVLLGYQDPCYEQRSTNSPTTTRQTRQLQLQLAASLKFRMYKGDVTGAFLQSRPYPGDLYCIPAPEICEAMGLPPESITKVRKACYGLVDAPLEWYRSICECFERLGLKRCWSDPCCWIYLQDGSLKGIISGHVDDFLFSGDEKCAGWTAILAAIKQEYKWGDWEHTRFVQCGVLLEQHEDFSFSLSQEKYVEDLKYINLRAHRKKDRSSPTDDWEKTQLRTLLGGVSWHAQQVAPHFAAEVGLLLSEVNRSSIDTVLRANRLMDKVKSLKDHRLKVHAIPVSELALYVWVDAGSQNRPDGSSTQGIVLGIASQRMSNGECVDVTLVSWHSQKIERRCRSPGAAEALAAVNGEDSLYYGRFQLAEMLGCPVNVKNIDDTVNQVMGTLVTDSRNVYDKMETETLSIKGAEKRTDLELLALKEFQLRNKVHIRWVHGEAQLSNGLTKGSEYKQLELFYSMNQRWRIVEDVERASARRRKALGLSPLEPREERKPELPEKE